MGTLNGIAYTEFPDTNTLDFAPEGVVGRRIFKVAWGDRITFCRALLGYVTETGHVPLWTHAQQFPDYDYLYCQNASVEGIGQLGEVDGAATYEVAKIRASYRHHSLGHIVPATPDDEDLDTDMLRFEQALEFSGEMVSIPGSELVYADTLVAVGEPFTRIVGTVDLTLASNQEVELAWQAIGESLGRVNDATWLGHAAGFWLFLGASSRRTLTAEGIGAWELMYRFRLREISWNATLRGGESVLVHDAVGRPPYPGVSFPALFTAPTA